MLHARATGRRRRAPTRSARLRTATRPERRVPPDPLNLARPSRRVSVGRPRGSPGLGSGVNVDPRSAPGLLRCRLRRRVAVIQSGRAGLAVAVAISPLQNGRRHLRRRHARHVASCDSRMRLRHVRDVHRLLPCRDCRCTLDRRGRPRSGVHLDEQFHVFRLRSDKPLGPQRAAARRGRTRRCVALLLSEPRRSRRVNRDATRHTERPPLILFHAVM